MKKSYLLFLLLLLSVIGSVNATTYVEYYTSDIPETCTPTNYYVVYDDDTLTTELLTLSINGTEWGDVAPSISGIDGNVVYFSSKYDMARFCSIMSRGSASLISSGAFVPYENGLALPMTVIHAYKSSGPDVDSSAFTTSGYLTINISQSQVGYIFAGEMLGDYSACKVCVNTVEILPTVSYHVENDVFDSAVFSPSTTVEFWYRNTVNMQTSIVLFDYVDSCEYTTINSITYYEEIYTPAERYDLTVMSNVDDIEVYFNSIDLGTVDDGSVLQLTEGTYDLTFTKEGYWNETKTVVVTDEGATVDVTMFPDSELYLISSNITTQNIVTNMDVTMNLHIVPMVESQNTMISFDREIVSIKEGTEELTKDGDNYVIGNFNEPIDLTVKFNSGTLTGNRYIECEVFGSTIIGTQTTDFDTLKSITYSVNSLPIIVYMPSWTEGVNELRITEQEGNTLILNVEVLDISDNSKYSQNVVFNPYGVETLDINLTEGTYFLHLYCNDFDTNIPFTVSASSTSDDSDITGVIVTSDDSIVDLVYDYWYVPVALGIVIGVYFVSFKKKDKKPAKLKKGGKNAKK